MQNQESERVVNEPPCIVISHPFRETTPTK